MLALLLSTIFRGATTVAPPEPVILGPVYGTIEGFKAYHLARGRAVVAFEDAQIAADLLIASEWLDATYRMSFGGLKVLQRGQEREWPRTGAFDIYGYAIPSDSVPFEVQAATYEAAYRLAQGVALSTDFTPPKYKRASVDGAVSVEYVTGASAADMQVQFAVIDQILSAITTGFGGGFASYSGGISRV